MPYNCDFLLQRFAASGQDIAFIDEGQSYSYDWILQQTPEYEKFLDDHGVQRGDVVVVIADYSPQVFCFLLATIRRGVIVAPLTHESVVEVETIVTLAEAQWVLQFHSPLDKMVLQRYDNVVRNPVLTSLLAADAPGLLLFSSGSTGVPKGILLDFRAVLEKFRRRRPRVTAIAFLLLDHFGGINTLFHILANGGTVVTVQERSVKSICATIEEFQVELLPTTPSFLNILVHSDILGRHDLSSLQTISYGTEVMPQATLDRLRALLPGVKLVQTYGLSELGVLRTQSRPDGSLWLKLGGEGFESKVVDDLLWIRSEYAMVGYLNAPSPFDEDGWFNTQDRVEVDGDYVRILGRVTDLMNIGGQKVYPSEVENVIISLDNIEDVRVYAEPHPLMGSMIVAEVVLAGPENLSEVKRRIRRACAQRLTKYKVPSKVIEADGALYSARQKKLREPSTPSS